MSNRRSAIPYKASQKSFTRDAKRVHKSNAPRPMLGALRGGERK